MSTKNNPGPFDCYANAAPDEPMFVLLARSKYSAALVNLYAAMKRAEVLSAIDASTTTAAAALDDGQKISEAEAVANDMVAWRYSNGHIDDVAGIRALAEGLALMAEQCGAVVRIELQPLQPLAMGNYCHAVQVYPKHAGQS
jgi:hypothetical protein